MTDNLKRESFLDQQKEIAEKQNKNFVGLNEFIPNVTGDQTELHRIVTRTLYRNGLGLSSKLIFRLATEVVVQHFKIYPWE